MVGSRSTREPLLPALAHEVSNLLAGIRLMAHLLDESDPAATRTTAAEIEALVEEAGAWLAQVRPLSRRSRSATIEVEPAGLLEGVRAALGPSREGVLVRIPARPLGPIQVDPSALHHALVLLVVMPLREGARQVSLGARRVGTGVRFSVEDDGPPLPRAEGMLRGSTLSLAVIDELASHAGGEARRKRARGKTRVDVEFPRAEAVRRPSG